MLIFITIIFVIETSLNPFLNQLIDGTRSTRVVGADSLWKLYLESLKKEKKFSEHTEQLGGLTRIKDYETKFVNGALSEAEFCYWIGYEFARDVMALESEWFLNKAESLGFVCAETYLMHASNYADEWNDVLHYNEDLSDPQLAFYERKWQESLKKFIASSNDSLAVDNARLQLTGIYAPFGTPIYIMDFAPGAIKKLEDFIKSYSRSLLIEKAYEQLVWWLNETKQFKKLKKVSLEFLKNYPNSSIREYIKFQLGDSYYWTNNYHRAKTILQEIKIDSFPQSVYPGWRKDYIIELISKLLDEIKKKE